MAWDPRLYLTFGNERTRPATDLLAHITLDMPARVADLGCGPGNSTALLAARWPLAQLDGIDSSPQMLNTARQSDVRANWIEADLVQWHSTKPYDLLFSNATLQWVPDHARLLPHLLAQLATNGILAVQMPRNFSEASHTLMQSVAAGRPWQHKFEHVRDGRHVLTPEDYYALLEPHCAAIDIWETTYLHVLTGADAVFHWTSATGLRPYADALHETERTEFLALYREAVGRAYPQRSSGVTLLPFRRLFFVARAR